MSMIFWSLAEALEALLVQKKVCMHKKTNGSFGLTSVRCKETKGGVTDLILELFKKHNMLQFLHINH